MKSKIIIVLIAVFSFGSFVNANTISIENSRELLSLVVTNKDYSDAINLISESNFLLKIKSDKQLASIIKELAKELGESEPDWLLNDAPDETRDINNSEQGPSEEKKEARSLWTIFFLAFAAGFAALLTPCVFPMIPMTVSFFTKQSKSKAQGIRNAVIFGISIIVIYVLPNRTRPAL